MGNTVNIRALVYPLCLAALFSCASVGGDGDDGYLSLDEALEKAAGDIAGTLPAGTRVAIVAFDSESENLSEYIMEELSGALVEGGMEVADRGNLPYIYNELDFQMSGSVSDETALSVGKFAGAGVVITGQFVNAGGRYRCRVSSIHTETAVHAASTRLNVRNDRELAELFAALRDRPLVRRAAAYGTEAAPKTAGAFLDRGILFASRGDYDMAAEDFTRAIELGPTLGAAYMLRGRALFAGVSRVTAAAKNVGSVDTVSTGGTISEAARRVYDLAIADFTQAIRLDPDNAQSYSERGVVYGDSGDYDLAIADFSQVIRLKPNNAVGPHNRGIAYTDKGDYDRAIADLSQAVTLDPYYASAFYNRGNAYSGKGDYDRAVADFTQAVTLDPHYAWAFHNRGYAYYNQGGYDQAIADYTRAIALDPGDALAFYNRGNAHSGKDDYDRAVADYTRALTLDPAYAPAFNRRGIAYAQQGDYGRAIADFTRALSLDPDFEAARQNLDRARQVP
jgi:tetratricopeptide (TPR) repeat protein